MALQQCRGRSLQAIFCGCPRLFWVNHYLNGFAWHVRFTPDSDRTADVAGGPVRADFVAKSKIERPRKSRESGFLDAAAAARFSGANTKAGGRFYMKRSGPSRRRGRSASAVFKIFVLHSKKTFSTKSAKRRLAAGSKVGGKSQRPVSGGRDILFHPCGNGPPGLS
jgi:hypothetical protein